MNRTQKRTLKIAGIGALLLWALSARAAGKGKVLIGPVTVTKLPPVQFDAETRALVERLSLGLIRMRQLCGYDPNTLASRQPNAAEVKYCEDVLILGREVQQRTSGLVPDPKTEAAMLTLAKKLPGSTLQTVNAQLYQLLGIDPKGNNEPTKPLTPAIENAARALIAKWRPYSQQAVDTLYAQLDLARELGGQA